MSRIEQLIGEAILQDSRPLEIKGVGTIQVANPSLATLIEASKTIGQLPQLPPMGETGQNAVTYALAYARECSILGDLAAVLILGSKLIRHKVKKPSRAFFGKNNWLGRFLGLFQRKVLLRTLVAEALLEDYTPQQLENIIAECLGTSQIAFFLNIITTLNDANVLRQTTSGTTASGQ